MREDTKQMIEDLAPLKDEWHKVSLALARREINFAAFNKVYQEFNKRRNAIDQHVWETRDAIPDDVREDFGFD